MKLHVLYGHDNNRYAFLDSADVVRCERCHGIIDKWNDERHMSIKNPDSINLDVSTTYDGALVVSFRFRRVFDDARLNGLTFEDIGSGYAVIRATRRVGFDVATRKTRLENRCANCGIHESVIGATPAFLVPPVDIGPDEFVWTDMEFGSGDEKSPLLICGERAAKALKTAKLTGLEFTEVPGREPVRG